MKRRFEFRLRRLKRLRETEEKVARAVWATAERAALDAEDARQGLRREVERAQEELGGELAEAGPLSPDLALLSHRAIDTLLEALRRRKERALTLRSQADGQAEAWRERDSRKRALIELEERRRVRHRKELEQCENAERDEIASIRAARARRLDGNAAGSPGRGFSGVGDVADSRPGSPGPSAEDPCPS